MKKFKITHISDNGDKSTFEPKETKLLDYKALIKTKYEKKTDLEFKILASKSILNGKHLEKDYNTVTISNWTPCQEQTIYAITLGGWLPFSFIDESIIIADRNVIDRIKKISDEKSNDTFRATDWWLKFHKNFGLTINPLLYAMEGNKKRVPNFHEFCQSFSEAGEAITSYLPSFKTVSYSEEDYREVFTMIQGLQLIMKREIEFLCEVIPLVWKTQKIERLKELEEKINERANAFKISGRLSHLAVLDLLYEDTSTGLKSHGRGLLKPKKLYLEENAYNALSDLLNLEILLHLSREFDKVFFCTADFNLAAFWIALNIHNVSYDKGKLNIKFTTENLFSRSDGLKIFEKS